MRRISSLDLFLSFFFKYFLLLFAFFLHLLSVSVSLSFAYSLCTPHIFIYVDIWIECYYSCCFCFFSQRFFLHLTVFFLKIFLHVNLFVLLVLLHLLNSVWGSFFLLLTICLNLCLCYSGREHKIVLVSSVIFCFSRSTPVFFSSQNK